MARILVVEDEPGLAGALRLGLQDERHVVHVEADGQEGLFAALGGGFDLVILDRMLPRFSGDDLCRRLRLDGSTVPVLMLTARDTPRDVVEGLDAGADDYLTKPFAFEELLARVRALLRRVGPLSAALRVGALELDPGAHRAWCDGAELALTLKEFQLLTVLARRRGRVQPKAELARAAWDDEEVDDNLIEVHVSHLRRKLPAGWIRTVRGVGYLLEEPS